MPKALENLSRRSLITGAAALPVVALLPASAAVAAAVPALAAPAVQENPELLAIGEQIDPLLKVLRDAHQHRQNACNVAEALVPKLPDELVAPYLTPHERHLYGDRERNVVNEEIMISRGVGSDGRKLPETYRMVIFSENISDAFKRGNLVRNSTYGRRMAKVMKIAKKYETAKIEAINRSGLVEALLLVGDARRDFDILANKTTELAPRTAQGVVIHARMLMAYGESSTEPGYHPNSGLVYSNFILGSGLARAVLNVAGLRGVS